MTFVCIKQLLGVNGVITLVVTDGDWTIYYSNMQASKTKVISKAMIMSFQSSHR